jgi:hypothetical protein
VLDNFYFEKGWLLLALFLWRDFDLERDRLAGFAEEVDHSNIDILLTIYKRCRITPV